MRMDAPDSGKRRSASPKNFNALWPQGKPRFQWLGRMRGSATRTRRLPGWKGASNSGGSECSGSESTPCSPRFRPTRVSTTSRDGSACPSRRLEGRSFERGKRDAGNDQDDADEVVPERIFAEEQRGEEHAEGGQEMRETAGARRAEPRHGVVPAGVGEDHRGERRVQHGQRAVQIELRARV